MWEADVSCSPGFNDTYRSETEVLQDISKWLQETYEQNNKLTGIIYLHGINHARVQGSALQNLKMFRELCGPDPLKNVVLVTTFWNSVSTTVGSSREDELASDKDFWAGMLQRGSRMERFTDRASGLKILESLIGNEPEVLKIQKELVEDKKQLIDTGAGQIVNEELVRLEKLHQAKIEQVHKDMEEALKQRDYEMQEIIEERSRQLEDEISRVHRQQEQLKADRRAETRRLENQFDNAMYELKARNEELEQTVEDLRGDSSQRKRERVAQDQRLIELESEVRRRQQEREAQDKRLEELESDVQKRKRERAAQDRRLRELEEYNRQAVQKWEGLDIDAVVAKIRAEESKLRVEEREKLEAEIQRLHLNEKQRAKGRKRDTAVNAFFGVLRVALPLASMFTLGIPINLPFMPSSDGGAGC